MHLGGIYFINRETKNLFLEGDELSTELKELRNCILCIIRVLPFVCIILFTFGYGFFCVFSAFCLFLVLNSMSSHFIVLFFPHFIK